MGMLIRRHQLVENKRRSEFNAVLAETREAAQQFNPANHTVEEVQSYLDSADNDERARVLAVEQQGKDRKALRVEDPEVDES